ncbi:hypothetical protein H4R99_005873 [Coemansia sp. RSA 1722]|nr:hypothetical protein H4R99_005873 [Coemansia sp. RSA 1722]KAJ2637164.1 hypothetical protein GGF40_002549 [Coemansia sp. RSA 1286]
MTPAALVDDFALAATNIADSLDKVSQVIKQCANRIRSDSAELQSALQIIAQTADSQTQKIIFTGVGKSFLIGKKLAATLTSVGTPAVSLHSTEAMHGDLGIIHPGDCVIALSYSGNTEEVIRLFTVLRGMRSSENRALENTVWLVGMGRTGQSPLGNLCDAWIESAVDQELSLSVNAPTSSSSLMLAIGDAIAILLMNRRQFGPTDFARNHPGGHLGIVSRQLAAELSSDSVIKNGANPEEIQPKAY